MSDPHPSVALIYARSENHCIGRDGGLPWRLPDEFAHFKRTTMGCPIIMGRKTYEDHQSALPGRTNIVVSRQAGVAERVAEGVVVVGSLDRAIALAEAESPREVFVIGGAGLLAEAYARAGRVYETVVHTEVAGDVFVEPFDFAGWASEVLIEHGADDRHAYAFTATRYDRK